MGGRTEVVAYNQDPSKPFASDALVDSWAGTSSNLLNHSNFEIAVGGLARDNSGDQEIVIASRASDGILHITQLN